MKTLKKILSLALFVGALVPSLHAQTYSIDWHKVAGGSGTSSGGEYSLSGTIGQHDASGTLSGGSYTLTGGFWSIISVVQTSGAPLLTITYSDNQAVVSWPVPSTGWTLQTNSTLNASSWGNYTGTISNNSVTNAPPRGNLFFRLTSP